MELDASAVEGEDWISDDTFEITILKAALNTAR